MAKETGVTLHSVPTSAFRGFVLFCKIGFAVLSDMGTNGCTVLGSLTPVCLAKENFVWLDGMHWAMTHP